MASVIVLYVAALFHSFFYSPSVFCRLMSVDSAFSKQLTNGRPSSPRLAAAWRGPSSRGIFSGSFSHYTRQSKNYLPFPVSIFKVVLISQTFMQNTQPATCVRHIMSTEGHTCDMNRGLTHISLLSGFFQHHNRSLINPCYLCKTEVLA